MKPFRVLLLVLAVLLALLQYKLWFGNGGQREVKAQASTAPKVIISEIDAGMMNARPSAAELGSQRRRRSGNRPSSVPSSTPQSAPNAMKPSWPHSTEKIAKPWPDGTGWPKPPFTTSSPVSRGVHRHDLVEAP